MIHPALRPDGFKPLLHGQASQDRRLTGLLLDAWDEQGFSQVAPISVDYADSLFSDQNQGAGLGARAFRFMDGNFSDANTGALLALLPDVTLGIARLARGELADEPRPLRVSYEGQAVRAIGSATRPVRQFGQVGVEAIGLPPDQGQTALDLISLALRSLYDLGLKQLTLTLVDPPFAARYTQGALSDLGLSAQKISELAQALDRKDEGKIKSLSAHKAPQLLALMNGEIEGILELRHLLDLKNRLLNGFPGQDLTIHIEPFEQRGFPFQSGPSFALYTHGLRGELGRGGAYTLGDEACFGFTLFRDALLQKLNQESR